MWSIWNSHHSSHRWGREMAQLLRTTVLRFLASYTQTRHLTGSSTPGCAHRKRKEGCTCTPTPVRRAMSPLAGGENHPKVYKHLNG